MKELHPTNFSILRLDSYPNDELRNIVLEKVNRERNGRNSWSTCQLK